MTARRDWSGTDQPFMGDRCGLVAPTVSWRRDAIRKAPIPFRFDSSCSDREMNSASWYRRMINGDGGPLAAPLRAVLGTASWGYRFAVERRNAYFDNPRHCVTLPVPVISVGNLTVGGTGKTPMVIDLVRRLDAMGRNPAVVARGYAAADGEGNDEQRLIQSRCPGVIYVADADRVAASREAIDRCGANVIVLDDGFQHRRLARNLDIVLIDATCPFGFGHLLPRGLLREPPTSLERADLIVLTRCDQASADEVERARTRIHEIVGDRPVLKCRHHVTSIHRLDGSAGPPDLTGRRMVVFAGIANPRSLFTTVSTLGAEIVAHHWWPDHHAYSPSDLRALARPGRFPTHDAFVTTEKDAVKLAAIPEAEKLPILVLRVSIAFEGDGGAILQKKLEQVVLRGESP